MRHRSVITLVALGMLVFAPARAAEPAGTSIPTRSHLRVFGSESAEGDELNVLEALRLRPGRDPLICVGASRNHERDGRRLRIVEYGCAPGARVYEVDPVAGTARVRAAIPTEVTRYRAAGRDGWVPVATFRSRATVSVDWQAAPGAVSPWGARLPVCIGPLLPRPCVDPSDPDTGGVGISQPAVPSGRLRFGSVIGTVRLAPDSDGSIAWAVP